MDSGTRKGPELWEGRNKARWLILKPFRLNSSKFPKLNQGRWWRERERENMKETQNKPRKPSATAASLLVAICCYLLLFLARLKCPSLSILKWGSGPRWAWRWKHPSFWLAQRELNSDLARLGSSWFHYVPLFPFLLETQMIHMWVLHSTGSAFLQADLKGDEGTIAIVLDGCCTPCLAWSWFIAVSFHPVNPNLHQLGNLIPGLWKTEVGHGCCWGGNIGVDRVWSSSCTGSLFDRSLYLKRELSDLAIGLTCLVRECTAGSGSLLRDLFVGLRRSCIIMASLLITAQAHQNQLDTLSTTLLSSLSSP